MPMIQLAYFEGDFCYPHYCRKANHSLIALLIALHVIPQRRTKGTFLLKVFQLAFKVSHLKIVVGTVFHLLLGWVGQFEKASFPDF